MKPVITSLFFFLGTVLADANAISAAMDNINQREHDVNDTMSKWDGGMMSAVTILTKSMNLVDAIHNATNVVKQEKPLSDNDAKMIQQKSQALIDDGKSTLNTLVASKSKFDGIPGASMFIKSSTSQQKDASTVFSMYLMQLMPDGNKQVAKDQVSALDSSFDAAIKAYS